MVGESIISDPGNPEQLFVGEYIGKYMLSSTTGGDFWKEIGIVDGGYLCTIAKPTKSNTIFAGSDSGVIRKSTNLGVSWKVVANFTNGLYSGEVTSIVFSKINPDVGYAVMTYVNSKQKPNGGLYKTVDGGEKWNKIGFADTSLWSVAVRTVGNQDEVYVGGYAESIFPERFIAGQDIVSRSPNSGASWERIDNSIDWSDTIHHNVWMMKFVEDTPLNEKLYMATEAGFFVMDVPVSVQENEPFPVISDDWNAKLINGTLTVFSPKNINSNSEYTVRLYSLVGEKIAEQTTTGSKELFVGTFSRGMYLCQITSGQSRKNILLISQ